MLFNVSCDAGEEMIQKISHHCASNRNPTLPCGPWCQTLGDSSCPPPIPGSPSKASEEQLETSAIHFASQRVELCGFLQRLAL